MSKRKKIPYPEPLPCKNCGSPGQEKVVCKPFTHGWVGCKACGNYIPWTNAGRRSALEQWNNLNSF